MLQLMKIRGHSLFPDYREGDYVLVVRFPFPAVKIREGDVIVFDQPGYSSMIKRVCQVIDDGSVFEVRGTQIDSTDSRNFGPVMREQVTGKVIWHIRQPKHRTE
jgi:signal peptidase I